MVMFDNYAIKKRIKEIIEADKDLFNAKGEDGKLLQVFVGMPKNNNIYAIGTPYLVITNAPKFITAIQAAGITNNGYTSKDYTVNYTIIVIDKQQDGPAVEKSLDAILKKLTDTLDANVTLRKSDGSDELVKNSIVGQVQMLGAGQFRGKATDGFEMNLICRIFTS